jgi:hypothetical protein
VIGNELQLRSRHEFDVSVCQKTKDANLGRNSSSGKYFARFRHDGKLIWIDLAASGRCFSRLRGRVTPDVAALEKLPPYLGTDPQAFAVSSDH